MILPALFRTVLGSNPEYRRKRRYSRRVVPTEQRQSIRRSTRGFRALVRFGSLFVQIVYVSGLNPGSEPSSVQFFSPRNSCFFGLTPGSEPRIPGHFPLRRHSQAVRQRSAKPSSPVRFRVAPPDRAQPLRLCFFCLEASPFIGSGSARASRGAESGPHPPPGDRQTRLPGEGRADIRPKGEIPVPFGLFFPARRRNHFANNAPSRALFLNELPPSSA